LINQVANKVIEVDLGTSMSSGNYDYYLYKKQLMEVEELQDLTGTVHPSSIDVNPVLLQIKRREAKGGSADGSIPARVLRSPKEI